MTRQLLAMAMAAAMLGVAMPPAVMPPRLHIAAPAEVDPDKGDPFRGASRDRSLHGKARRRARRA